jgi:hypothetical protein
MVSVQLNIINKEMRSIDQITITSRITAQKRPLLHLYMQAASIRAHLLGDEGTGL